MELIRAQAIPSERSGLALADRPAPRKPRARGRLATALLRAVTCHATPAVHTCQDARIVILDGMGATRRANPTWYSGSRGSARCERLLLSRSRRPQIVTHTQRLPHRRVDHERHCTEVKELSTERLDEKSGDARLSPHQPQRHKTLDIDGHEPKGSQPSQGRNPQSRLGK